MKKGIHPKYYPNAKVICSCGNTWTTGSTKPEIHTDLCNVCHPFFTGEQRIVDTAGQVDRFVKRLEAKEEFEAAARQRAEAAIREKEERKRRRRMIFAEKESQDSGTESGEAQADEA
ncbi:MAG: 50S ribosomal protein L31 [Chloroflexi bacterium]|nr:50S ribosomal protein L31 [Chloroflexota bacterium]